MRDDGGFELDLKVFCHATEKVDYEWDGGSPTVGRLFTPALEALLGPAGAGQSVDRLRPAP